MNWQKRIPWRFRELFHQSDSELLKIRIKRVKFWVLSILCSKDYRDLFSSEIADYLRKLIYNLLIHNFPVIIFTILAPKTSSETFGIWIKFSSQCSKTKAMWCNKCWRNWNLVLQPLPIPRDSSKSCEIWEMDSRSSFARYFFGCFEESFNR